MNKPKSFDVDAQKKKVNLDNILKSARATGSLSLSNRAMKTFPPEVSNFSNLNFDQKWWELVPLSKLDLSNNEIDKIPPTILNEPEIQVFRMTNNLLEDIPEEVFMLTNLKNIDFSNNKIRLLPNSWANSQSLVEANLYNNKLTQLPNLLSLRNLEILNISENSITNLPSFVNLGKLKRLDFSNNKIKQITAESIRGLTLLEFLILSKNEVAYIEPRAFLALKNIVLIDLRENFLTEFYEIPDSPKLDTIILAYNRIKNVGNFQTAKNLSVLDLKNNKLETLSSDICFLQGLKTLDLSNNDLSDIPSELGLMTKLVRINIEGNPLKLIRTAMRTAGAEVLKKYLASRIEGNIDDIQKKINPSIKPNKAVDFWEQVFRDFYLNGELVARGLQIKDINPRVFSIEKLKTLDLSKNEITVIDRDVANLNTLKKLRMNENNIEEIPLEVNYLSELVEIEFRQNKLSDFLSKLPLQKIALINLVSLDLSVNKFTSVPKCIVALSNVKVLNMAFNNITNIDILFCGELKMIEVLDFSNNKIDALSDEIYSLKEKLGFLNLEYNNLSKFPTLVGFMDLKSLKLDGNPLKIIKRTIIEKGTVAILDFLRNRHVGDPPQTNMQAKLAYNPNHQQANTQMYVEKENQTNIQPLSMAFNPYQGLPKQELQLGAKMVRNEPPKDNGRSQLENEVRDIEKKMGLIERELNENFGMNAIQRNNKKKEYQSLLVMRSNLLQRLEGL